MRTRANPVYCGIDTIDLAQATKLIRNIAGGPKPAVGGIKLGLEFFLAHGAPGVRYAFPTPVRATGVGFFLDLKLHDIPNTVAGGIRSPLEIAALRKQCGPDFVLMVPGIRPVGSAANDQKRAMTPRQAVDLGATNLVVGRPIYQAADPRAAAEAIAREAGVNDL